MTKAGLTVAHGGVSDQVRARTGVVSETVSADVETTASRWVPKDVHDGHVRFFFFFARAMFFVMFPCWQACRSFSLLLHWLHVSSPKGALTPGHHSFPHNLHQGTAFTRASKADHFRGKLFKYLTRCAIPPP